MSKMGQELIESLNEALAHAERKTRLRTRTLEIPDVKVFTSGEIKELRQSLGFSQAVFASTLGVSGRTVEEWERGKNTPSGSSNRLLELIQKSPDTIRYIWSWLSRGTQADAGHPNGKTTLAT
ncbi:MAG: helix-turn-helix domain-containing protein [Firmicutes bacterium]|nr:helix-turn-helix domain-containing protein [Bacillota bacterium]